eukprot:scaffold155_cov347-Pavlova_lutheri.AAC.32
MAGARKEQARCRDGKPPTGQETSGSAVDRCDGFDCSSHDHHVCYACTELIEQQEKGHYQGEGLSQGVLGQLRVCRTVRTDGGFREDVDGGNGQDGKGQRQGGSKDDSSLAECIWKGYHTCSHCRIHEREHRTDGSSFRLDSISHHHVWCFGHVDVSTPASAPSAAVPRAFGFASPSQTASKAAQWCPVVWRSPQP